MEHTRQVQQCERYLTDPSPGAQYDIEDPQNPRCSLERCEHFFAIEISLSTHSRNSVQMSWLRMSPSDASVAPYIAEIQRLERELGRANESIDEKLDRLENAGFGNVELEMRLNDERAKTIALEEDIARLDRREDRRLRRLAKAKCPRCRQIVDLRSLSRVGDGDER